LTLDSVIQIYVSGIGPLCGKHLCVVSKLQTL